MHSSASDTKAKQWITIWRHANAPKMRDADTSSLVKNLSIEIAMVARDYGATKTVPEETLAEAISTIRSQYGYLGVMEIRLAYRTWAAGSLGEGVGTMWRGVFNVKHLCEILNAYTKYRREILKIVNDVFENQKQKALPEPVEALTKASVMAEIETFREAAVQWRTKMFPHLWPKAKAVGLHKELNVPMHEILDQTMKMCTRMWTRRFQASSSRHERDQMLMNKNEDIQADARMYAARIAIYFILFHHLPNITEVCETLPSE